MNFDLIINGLNSMRVNTNIATNAEKLNSTDNLNFNQTTEPGHFANTRDTLELSLDNLSAAKSELTDISIAAAVMKITANDIKINPRDAMLTQANINPAVIAKLIVEN